MAGTMPVLAEISGQQELYTRDHGTVKVAGLSFIDGGFHIVKCPNGAYMHSNGLPVTDEDQLRAAIPNPFLEDALKWFTQRHTFEENPPQPIGFHPQGYPIFEDGSIPDFADLYAYFSPGAILTAAIVALQQYIDRTPGFVAQKLKMVQVPDAPDAVQAPPPRGPMSPEAEQIAILTARAEAAEKALATEKAKPAPKAKSAVKRKKTASKPAAQAAPVG